MSDWEDSSEGGESSVDNQESTEDSRIGAEEAEPPGSDVHQTGLRSGRAAADLGSSGTDPTEQLPLRPAASSAGVSSDRTDKRRRKTRKDAGAAVHQVRRGGNVGRWRFSTLLRCYSLLGTNWCPNLLKLYTIVLFHSCSISCSGSDLLPYYWCGFGLS